MFCEKVVSYFTKAFPEDPNAALVLKDNITKELAGAYSRIIKKICAFGLFMTFQLPYKRDRNVVFTGLCAAVHYCWLFSKACFY